MSPSLKRWLHFAGGLLGLLGAVFVGCRLYSYSGQIDFAGFGRSDWLMLVILACVYGAANFLLAVAWGNILHFLKVEVKWSLAVRVYALSQLAKYVPGNVFHFAGRQALGMAAGMSARPLAVSALWELGLISVAGAVFVVLVIPLVWPTLPILLAYLLFLAALVGTLLLSSRLLSKFIAAALSLQITFLVISGLVFYGTLLTVHPVENALPSLSSMCAAYIMAWLAGLVTPGAPAGVGVREAVLLFLLGEHLVEADLVLAIVLGRGVTVAGDLLFYIYASLKR